MTALLVIGIILLVFLFIGSLKATVTVSYGDDLALSVKVLFLRIGILPKKQKKGKRSLSARKAAKIRAGLDKKKQKKADAAKQKKQAKAEKKKTKKKKSMSEILDLLRLITDLLGIVVKKFFKHIRINLKRLKLTVATPDAATTAIAYGAATQTISILLPLIQSVKQVSLPREKDFDIGIDFLSDAPTFDLELSVSLRVWHVFDIGFGALGRLIKHLIKNMGSKEGHRPPTPPQNSKESH